MAAGQLAGGLAGLAQVGEVVVDVEVGELAEGVQGEAEVDNILVGRRGLDEGGGGEGRVELEGAEEPRERPVEEGVAEDVGEGHGVGGELVQEQRLELPLGEVQRDHGEGGLLRERQLPRAGYGRRHDVLD